MKTDRELLELAAAAAGIDLTEYSWFDTPFYTGFERRNLCEGGFDLPVSSWNPLTDDGDALRLAVKLDIPLSAESCNGAVWICKGDLQVVEPLGKDPLAATRRAIVRAAAAIGEKL